MKFSAEDFQRLYGDMPDDELRSLDRNELNEVARQCFDAEMAKRGLAAGARRAAEPAIASETREAALREPLRPLDEEAVEALDAEVDEDLAAAAIFDSREEATKARIRLQSAALPAFLEDDTEGGGGFRLLVAVSYVGQAREVLGQEE